tara:strand:- start:1523 stop:2746 length:1224 start_codon:yes stop_codon:yes gene_type:complete
MKRFVAIGAIGLMSWTTAWAGDLQTTGSQNFNNANTNDIRISDKDIQPNNDPNMYGVLLNSNLTGDNADILNSTIYSPSADAIEINTTSGGFRGVKIIGNTLYGGEFGSSSSAGFSIGIAKGRDMTIVGNISKVSRNEALHIEDDQENITIGNNVFVDCMADGARILNRSAAQPVLLAGNIFVKHASSLHQGKGIYLVYDANGVLSKNVMTANRVTGFDIGLHAPSKVRFTFDNNLIEDCNVAISNGNGIIEGTTFVSDCPTLLTAGNGSVTDRIVSYTTPTTILNFNGTSGYAGATLKGFAFPLDLTSVSQGYATHEMFTLPKRLAGRITVHIINAYDQVFYSANVHWDGSTLTTTDVIKNTNGVFASPSLIRVDANNTLALKFYVATGRNIQTATVDFDGVYFAK